MEKDLGTLTNEMTYRKYLMEKIDMEKLFRDISILDYNAMQAILKCNEGKEEDDKIYLRKLAEELKLPISQVSQMIGRLQENGMVKWKHDGKGEQGTYIMITEKGKEAVYNQHEVLKQFYSRVITRYGHDKFTQMLEMVTELEDIMTEELVAAKEI
ncbi:MAG: hypothetical protein ACI39Q_09430 [Wujia sp.]